MFGVSALMGCPSPLDSGVRRNDELFTLVHHGEGDSSLAGTPLYSPLERGRKYEPLWIPAFAGMTGARSG